MTVAVICVANRKGNQSGQPCTLGAEEDDAEFAEEEDEEDEEEAKH